MQTVHNVGNRNASTVIENIRGANPLKHLEQCQAIVSTQCWLVLLVIISKCHIHTFNK